MRQSFTLSVPNACSENWNTFTPTATGGFCGTCCKNVIDFTEATDDEIIAFIKQNSGPACGRFRSTQLKTYSFLPEERIRPGFTLLKAGILSLLLLLLTKHAEAQVASQKPLIEIVHPTKNIDQAKNTGKLVISGLVISGDDQLPLPGVSILQKGSVKATFSDADGRFELVINPREGHILTVSFIGMITKEVVLPEAAEIRLTISLDPDVSTLGEVVIVGEVGTEKLYEEQPSRLKKLWNKVRDLF